tara:strand:- start:13435 stop:14814 length:1380 start_codon:yes stop_codon:yes gene_type:complete
MKLTANFFHNNFPLLLSLLIISCDSKYELDLNNIEEIGSESNNNFPSIGINTFGEKIIDEPKINAQLIHIEDAIETEYNIGIEIRGSSSQMFPKISYGFESKNNDYSEEMDIALGGFPEEEDWILYGPYSDKSLIRNKLSFDLSNAIGYPASRTKFYDLNLNGDFMGVYVLMEKIKRDKNRVDISKTNDDALDSGYIIKIDKPTGDGELCSTCYDESFSFRSNFDKNGNSSESSNIFFIYHYPKPDNITDEQKDFIFSIVNEFETNLLSDYFDDPEIGYESLIDIDSFIDFFIINELTKNPDAYRLSTFLNRDTMGKLKMGPVWDFNLAFGNVDYCDGMNTEGWVYNFNSICPSDFWQVPFWWNRLMESDNFKSKLKNRWVSLRLNQLSNTSIFNMINHYNEYLNSNKSISRNFNKWPILGQYIWPNYFVGESHESEIDFIKQWITNRLLWMDGKINNF